MNISVLKNFITICKFYGLADKDIACKWGGLKEFNKLCKERGMV